MKTIPDDVKHAIMVATKQLYPRWESHANCDHVQQMIINRAEEILNRPKFTALQRKVQEQMFLPTDTFVATTEGMADMVRQIKERVNKALEGVKPCHFIGCCQLRDNFEGEK